MKGGEFLNKIKRYTRKNDLSYRWVPAQGKGSHGTLYVGSNGRTTVKDLRKELSKSAAHDMCKQLGIDPKEIL